jgi:hypothetical protein
MTIEEYTDIPEKPYWNFIMTNWNIDIPVTIYENGKVDFELKDKYLEIVMDDLAEISRRAKLFRDRRFAFRQKEMKDYYKDNK